MMLAPTPATIGTYKMTLALMREDLAGLLALVAVHPGFEVVRLRRGGKEPDARKGQVPTTTQEPERVRAWCDAGYNVGLLAGEAPGLAVIEVDDVDALAELVAQLGPLGEPTTYTWRGRPHWYRRWTPGIPSTLLSPSGAVIGEPRRGAMIEGQIPAPFQYIVAPPSMVDVQPYRFANEFDPTAPLPEIPQGWREYFATMIPPTRVPTTATPEQEATATPLIAAALKQPGARQRFDGIKFRCPQCAEMGKDTANDNAKVFTNGRWGCAAFPSGVPGSRDHWIAIGEVLEALSYAQAALLAQRKPRRP